MSLKSAHTAKIGKAFVNARRLRSISQEEAASTALININFIKAIESGDYSIFPARIFAVQYFEKYAKFLNLDINFFDKDNINQEFFINFLKKANISPDNKIILFPGRLTKWKGQIEFLDIVSALKDKKIIFYFIGDDKNTSYKNKFINEINKKNLKL